MNLIRHGSVAVVLALSAAGATAQSAPAEPAEQAERTRHFPGHHGNSPVVDLVRRATAGYRDVDNATAEGYRQASPCVSGPSGGAMGIHYVNQGLIGDGAVDALRPEVLVYEPGWRGQLRLVAVEYLTLAEVWDGVNEGPPEVRGHEFHYVGAPNRSRLPAHYELHVWAWRDNPMGLFADFNPRASCEAFDSGT